MLIFRFIFVLCASTVTRLHVLMFNVGPWTITNNVLECKPIEAQVLHSDDIMLRKFTVEANGGVSGRGGLFV